MKFRHQLAVLLGAACLFLVVALSVRNLNSSSKVVNMNAINDVQAAATQHSWETVLQAGTEGLPIPNAILRYLGDSVELSLSDTGLLSNSIEFCAKNKFLLQAAYLHLKKAKLQNTAFSWAQASESVFKAASMEADSLLRGFLMQETQVAADEALTLDENQGEASLYKGLALTDNAETRMNGVPFLLKVVRANPNHLLANYTLGMLGIESGQYDKALTRFEKLISLQPSNPEYSYYAGQCASLSGDKEKAKKYYRLSLENTSDTELKEKINEIINQLN